MTLDIDILENLMRNQKNYIKYYIIFASVIISIGLTIVIISSIFSTKFLSTGSIKLILQIGGGFISTLSAFPIKEVLIKMEKISNYKMLLEQIDHLSKSELRKVDELIWESLKKTV